MTQLAVITPHGESLDGLIPLDDPSGGNHCLKSLLTFPISGFSRSQAPTSRLLARLEAELLKNNSPLRLSGLLRN